MIDLEKLMFELRFFGNTLKSQRHKLGKTLKMLEGEINANKDSIQHWENYNKLPSYEKLGLIAKAYELDEAELVNAYNISKKARETEKSMCKFRKKKPLRKSGLLELQEIIPPVVYQG